MDNCLLDFEYGDIMNFNDIFVGFGNGFYGRQPNKNNKIQDVLQIAKRNISPKIPIFVYMLSNYEIEIYKSICLDYHFFTNTVPNFHETNTSYSLPFLISDSMADHLLSHKFTINAKNETVSKRIEDYLENKQFYGMKKEIATVLSSMGSGLLKVNQINGEQEIEFIHPDLFYPVFEGKTLKEVYIFNIIEISEDNVITVEIEHRSSFGDQMLLRYMFAEISNLSWTGTKVDIKSDSWKLLEDLSSVTYDVPNLGCVYLRNKPVNFQFKDSFIGESDYAPARLQFLELDFSRTQSFEELRISKARIHMPERLINVDAEGNPKIQLDESLYTRTGGKENTDNIENTQFDFRAEMYGYRTQEIVNHCLSLVGLNPNSIVFREGQLNKTATEVIQENDKQYLMIQSKRDILIPEFQKLFEILAYLWFGREYKITLALPPLQYNNLTTISSNVQRLMTAKACSISEAVKLQHPDYDPNQILEEVIKIKTENAITLLPDEEEYAIDNGMKIDLLGSMDLGNNNQEI